MNHPTSSPVIGLVVGSTPPGTRSATAPARSLVSTLYRLHCGHSKLDTSHFARYTAKWKWCNYHHLLVNAVQIPHFSPNSAFHASHITRHIVTHRVLDMLMHFTTHTLHIEFANSTAYTLRSSVDLFHFIVDALCAPHFTREI